MQKFLAIALFVGSIGLFGWTMHAYSTSGEEVLSVPVTGRSGTLAPIALNPGMSPVRVFLAVKMEMQVRDAISDAYKYEVNVTDRLGDKLLSFTRTHSEKKEDQGPDFRRESQNHIIGTFDVPIQGPYVIDWHVNPKRADIKGITVSLRRNVEGMNIPLMLLAGFCFVLGWVVIFVGRRQ